MSALWPSDFKPGDKVRFYGLKAVVVGGYTNLQQMYPAWAVPIEIQRSGFATIAHVDLLSHRGRKKK